jgi:hypothetical protein
MAVSDLFAGDAGNGGGLAVVTQTGHYCVLGKPLWGNSKGDSLCE